MYDFIPLDQVLFIDIETVSEHDQLAAADEEMRHLWQQKASRFTTARDAEWTDELAGQLYEQRAAIHAEFGRVVVISVGGIYVKDGLHRLRTKSFRHETEKELLREFSDLLNDYANKFPGNFYLCGHNIKEFDIPYLCRRKY